MKELFRLTKSDKLFFLIYFLITFPIAVMAGEEKITLNNYIFALWFVISSFTSVYVIVFILFKDLIASKKYFLLIISLMLFLIIMGFIDMNVYAYLIGNMGSYDSLPANFILMGIVMHTSNMGILLGLILAKKFIESQHKLLKRESEQKTNELKLLKSQLDPHFLFNNLNTLDALVDTDPEKTKDFIQRLSNLYRYILSTKDEEIVSVKKELSFANDYIYLINERFGEFYQFNFHYKSDNLTNKLIPTGAIQVLYENIVKHNKAIDKQPIIVKTIIKENSIIVQNNIQQKVDKEVSFGIGLNNLKARYQLLSKDEITITVTDHFSVTLPLINQLND